MLTDDQGNIVTDFKYIPSAVYRITLKGSLASGGSFSEFGFQFTTGQYLDGNFTLTNAYQKSVIVNSIEYIEHSMPIPANNNTFETYFFWQAPPPGVGNIKFYCTMLAANGDHTGNGDISANNYVIFQEGVATAVNDLAEHAKVILYPNPVSDLLNIDLATKEYGNYEVNVFNLSGQKITQKQLHVQSPAQQFQINSSNWNKGLYFITVQKGNSRETFRMMKQ